MLKILYRHTQARTHRQAYTDKQRKHTYIVQTHKYTDMTTKKWNDNNYLCKVCRLWHEQFCYSLCPYGWRLKMKMKKKQPIHRDKKHTFELVVYAGLYGEDISSRIACVRTCCVQISDREAKRRKKTPMLSHSTKIRWSLHPKSFFANAKNKICQLSR